MSIKDNKFARLARERREKNKAAGQDTLFDVWRFHAFVTTTDPAILDTVASDKTHRRHAVIEQVEISVKYAGYIDKQNDEVARAANFENLRLPAELDYGQVAALSFEVRQKLSKHRPETLGQASRISGVTPAAISLLLIHLKKGRFKGFAANDRLDDAAA